MASPPKSRESRTPLASRVFREPRVLLAIALKMGAVFAFTAMLAIAKAFPDYPLTVIIFYRSFFALIVLLIWLAWRGAFPRALYTRRFGAHMVRSIAGIGSMFFMFAAYQMLPLADATAFSYLQPLMVALLAVVILGEKVTVLRVAAIVAGFSGILVMLWPQMTSGQSSPGYLAGALLGFLAALLVAIVFIQIRRLTETEDTGAITFYFQTTTTLAALAIMIAALVWPQDWVFAGWMRAQAWVWPRGHDWAPLIAIGVLGGFGQIMMTQAFRFSDASTLAVFDYSGLIWAIVLGYLFFAETPGLNVLAGAMIVIGAGLAVAWREGRAETRRALP